MLRPLYSLYYNIQSCVKVIVILLIGMMLHLAKYNL